MVCAETDVPARLPSSPLFSSSSPRRRGPARSFGHSARLPYEPSPGRTGGRERAGGAVGFGGRPDTQEDGLRWRDGHHGAAREVAGCERAPDRLGARLGLGRSTRQHDIDTRGNGTPAMDDRRKCAGIEVPPPPAVDAGQRLECTVVRSAVGDGCLIALAGAPPLEAQDDDVPAHQSVQW